jgi:hypothetical protein
MATPLNPLCKTDEELIAHILENPTLTREELLIEAAAQGFDLLEELRKPAETETPDRSI